MKKRHLSLVYVLICALAIAFVSCGVPAELKNSAEYLSHKSMAGRYPGTQENEAAASYIAQQLTAYGYAPLEGESMLTPFAAKIPSESKTTLIVDGTELIIGEDYITPIGKNFELSGIITQAEDGIVAINEAGDATMLFKASAKRLSSMYEENNSEQTVYLTKGGLEKVQRSIGKTASYTGTATLSDITLQNVLGVLPGVDRTKAVIIGAHFDHMGKVEGTDIIFNGAMDNVSGVASALYIASALKGTAPPVDIVFAFWNAEEFSLQGSLAGAASLETSYASYGYLNLDVLGIKNKGKLVVSTDNGSLEACDFLMQQMIAAGYTNLEVSKQAIGIGGDHQNFKENVSVAFSHTMEDMLPLLHSPEDTLDKLNQKELAKFSKALASVIKENADALANGSMYVKSNLSKKEFNALSASEQAAYTARVANSLALDEYTVLPNGVTIVNPRATAFATVQELQAIYPSVEIEQRVGAFELKGIRIYTRLFNNSPPETIVEKPYKHNFEDDIIIAVEAVYAKEAQAVLYRIEPGEQKDAAWLKNMYGSTVPVEGKADTYLSSYDDGHAKKVITLGSEYTQIISTGDLFLDENGLAGMLSVDVEDKALLDLIDTFSQELIKIG